MPQRPPKAYGPDRCQNLTEEIDETELSSIPLKFFCEFPDAGCARYFLMSYLSWPGITIAQCAPVRARRWTKALYSPYMPGKLTSNFLYRSEAAAGRCIRHGACSEKDQPLEIMFAGKHLAELVVTRSAMDRVAMANAGGPCASKKEDRRISRQADRNASN